VKSGDQWENTLRAYVTPHFGSLPIAQVDTPMVVKALSVIWTEKNETACRLRQRIEAILDWATVSGYRKGDNPARWNGHLEHVLPKPTKKTEHHAALPYSEMNAFMTALHEQKGVAALALEFTILTAARTGEVIGARWDEIDMDLMTWTIPAERMKAAKEHTVPLSQRALKILKDLDKEKKGPYVFPGGNEDAPLSNMAMAALLKRMELTEITVHGFRSTFRDWAGEQTNFPREVVEHALAHQLKDKAEAAYSRSTLPEKRRKLMEAWAQYALTKSPVAANIVAIRSA
jgi:integrase